MLCSDSIEIMIKAFDTGNQPRLWHAFWKSNVLVIIRDR